MSAKSNMARKGLVKAGKVHQFTCGVRQRLVGGGGHVEPEPIKVDRSSVTLAAIAVRFAQIEAQFAVNISKQA